MKRMILVISILVVLSLACATLTGGGNDTNTSGTEDENQPEVVSTPTPTPTGGGIEIEPSPGASRCEGLSGVLEMQVLVGPADAVGLPPVSMGEIPFSIMSEGGAYLVEGGTFITYEETLTEAWGTYSVSFNMEARLDGECVGDPGSEKLDITVDVSGEQMVEVRAEGFQGDYPWSGSHTLDLIIPLEDGATAQGEGWTFILHLSK